MNFKLFIKTYYPALLVFIILLAFSVAAYHGARTASYARRSKIFDSRVQRVKEDLKYRMTDYIQILKGCQSLFYASDTVTSADWKVYTENLKVSDNYPGIQAIAYAPYISQKYYPEFEKEFQVKRPEFRIKSNFEHAFLAPVLYIEPFNTRNYRAYGFDLYSDTIRREGIDRAISTGQAALTQVITLVQETHMDRQPGFLIFLPVYKTLDSLQTPESRKRNIKGVIANVFRSYDLMTVLFNRYTDLDIEVFEGDASSPDKLLYDSRMFKEAPMLTSDGSYVFKIQQSVMIAGIPWLINIKSNQQFGSVLERQQPGLILFFGIFISVLFFVLTFNIIKRKGEIAEELLLSKSLESKKDEFIGIASHELKTPLTSIKAFMQLLETSDLNERDRSFIKKANSNVNKLSNLIGDLLDVSKVQAGRLQLNVEPFCLSSMIDESIENVQHMYSSHQIIKNNEIPMLKVPGDMLRLEQTMTNLLVNAIKYSPGQPSIFVSAVKIKNEVRIDVTDKGLGISKENQERIFDRFFRAEELSPVISGLGMGLYISTEIVKQHNGRMSVKSTLGKGSTFSFTLPLTEKRN
ncbi:MAG: CHASE domain-containing protein [Daejeonella sp.]